jgi:hypothetical protein
VLQKPDGAGIKSPSATLSLQALQGLLNRLFRQIKGTPVNAEEVRAPNVHKDLERFLRSRMRGFHDGGWPVAADGDRRPVKWTQPTANLREEIAVACVAGEEKALGSARHRPPHQSR